MIPEHIKSDIEKLSERFSVSEIIDGNPVIIIVDHFVLPKGYKIDHTKLLIQIPIAYPNSKLDMFWVEENAVPIDKKLPFKEHKEVIANRNWFRYSWHTSNWTPGSDDIISFIEFIQKGLKQALK